MKHDHLIRKKHKNIRILDNRYYHVRIRRNRQMHHRLFSFTEWGSQLKALNGAIQYRDQLKCVLKFAKEYNLTIKDW